MNRWIPFMQPFPCWVVSRKWAGRVQNYQVGCVVFRRARHTSFSICPMTMVCWLFGCCTMLVVLTQNIFLRRWLVLLCHKAIKGCSNVDTVIPVNTHATPDQTFFLT